MLPATGKKVSLKKRNQVMFSIVLCLSQGYLNYVV